MTDWRFHEELKKVAEQAESTRIKRAAKMLLIEFDRLSIQECAYCNGFGHSREDCPTDKKLAAIRLGWEECTKVLNASRNERVEAVGMKDKSGYSWVSTRRRQTRVRPTAERDPIVAASQMSVDE